MQKSIKRGQVWFYKPSAVTGGSIQRGPRPVIIVSNDILNRTSSVVLGIPCTTQIKRNFATHTLFIMNKRVSVALTEQIMPVNVDDLTTLDYILEDYMMQQIDQALLRALALDADSRSAQHKAPPVNSEPVDNYVDNVDKKPVGNQVAKFYSKYPQLAPQKRSRYTRWTPQKVRQLVEDFEAMAKSNPEALVAKYGLSFKTLKTYYCKFKKGVE